jgi:hypothetical protein
VPHRVLDAEALPELGIRSVPTLLVIDAKGEVVRRRSGRAAITDAARVSVWMS